MRRLFISILLLSGIQLFAQVEDSITQNTSSDQMATISSKDDYQIISIFGNSSSLGGYGAFSLKASTIQDADILLLGGRGAFVIDHFLEIGMGGYGISTQPRFNSDSDTFQLGGGYGGLYVEPVLGSRLPVHVSFPILLGVGGIQKSEYDDSNGEIIEPDIAKRRFENDAFFIVEPGANLEFNLTKNVRLGAGASYRLIYGLDLNDVPNDILDNWAIDFTLKVGQF